MVRRRFLALLAVANQSIVFLNRALLPGRAHAARKFTTTGVSGCSGLHGRTVTQSRKKLLTRTLALRASAAGRAFQKILEAAAALIEQNSAPICRIAFLPMHARSEGTEHRDVDVGANLEA